MTRLSWHLEMIDVDRIEQGKYGGDLFCNARVENFFTLADVWSFLGLKLKKERCGYAGIKDGIYYCLTKM